MVCSFIVSWQSNGASEVYPWDVAADSVRFDLMISESEIQKLNRTLPELYHPLVKAGESGFSFVHQVYFGGSSAVLYFDTEILPERAEEVKRKALSAFSVCDFRAVNPKRIKIILDPDRMTEREAEKVLETFNNFPGLCKIVIRQLLPLSSVQKE